MRVVSDSAELFRHVSAEKAAFYRCIMDVFAAAKRQYRLQLRPDEVLAEARWPDAPPRIEDVSTALTQLAAWGNLESQPDTARVSSLSDFYRARFLYRLSQGGEAVEAALALFVQTLQRRAELQTVALEDIASRLQALRTLADAPEADVAKIHETLLSQLAKARAQLCYHGDFDWPGIRIGNHVMREHGAQSWRFGAADYEAAVDGATGLGQALTGKTARALWDEGLMTAM